MADAPKILGSDTLRIAYPKINQAIENANTAITKAETAETDAADAKSMSESTQTQLDTIVINGDSSVEAAQARVRNVDGQITTFDVLKDRLDNTDTQLTEKSQAIGDLSDLGTTPRPLSKGLSEVFVNIKDFGAKSLDEEADFDSTAAIQAAIDSVSTYSFSRGATIFFPLGVFKFTEVIVSSKFITLTGNGVLKGTIKVRGVENADPNVNNIPDMFTNIKGLRFIHDVGNNTDAIVFQNMRGATVEGCYFENYRNAVFGEQLRNDVPYQVTSRVVVEGCKFRNVDYAVKTQWMKYDSVTNGVVSPPTWRYNQHGDWQVSNCHMYFYSRGVSHCHFEGQDGLVCTNNIMFHALYTQKNQIKQHNIYLHQSNFAIISNNDLFEAGYESIYCTDPRSLIITDNNIAWCGQRDPRSGIYVEVADQSTYDEANIIIDSNNIAYPTRHGVWIGYFATNVKVSNNTVTKIGNSKFYYGTTDINSVSHYGIFVGDPNPTFSSKERVVVTNNFYDGILYQNRGVAVNNYPFSYVELNRTFGNLTSTARNVSGTFDLSSIITKQSNPFNETYPYIIKNVTGTISNLTGARQGQIVTLVCGVGTLTLNNNTAPDTLNIGSQTVLNQSEYITLQKTDTYWIKL